MSKKTPVNRLSFPSKIVPGLSLKHCLVVHLVEMFFKTLHFALYKMLRLWSQLLFLSFMIHDHLDSVRK